MWACAGKLKKTFFNKLKMPKTDNRYLVEGVPHSLERLPGRLRLRHPLLRETRVEPAAESVQAVPLALAVADHHDLVGGLPGIGCGWGKNIRGLRVCE